MSNPFGSGGKGTNPTGDPFGAESFDVGLLTDAANQNELAMHNRYQQLGIGVPNQPAPGDQNLTYGGPSTPEQQDLSLIPSETGGIEGQLGALLGKLQNTQTGNPIFNGTALNTLAQQAGFAAGSGGGGPFGNI